MPSAPFNPTSFAPMPGAPAPAEPAPRQQLQRLLPRHHKIVELALEGLDRLAIARMMGMSPVGVGLILASELVQDELARRRAGRGAKADQVAIAHVDVTKATLARASLDAAEKLHEQVEHPDPKIAQGACGKILDLVFADEKASAKGSGAGIVNINVEQLNVLMSALRESGRAQALPPSAFSAQSEAAGAAAVAGTER